jgi:DNA segregation ATPase FtsK/SpoIIIE, S-DNA-T family
MERLRVAVGDLKESFKARLRTQDPQHERITREIRGSIYGLLALFQLIALTSYIPIDSFNLFNGRLDHMNNMGGVVGAALGEWFLGTVGIMGYMIVLVTTCMAALAFRGRSFRDYTLKFIGVFLFTILGSLTCHLVWGATTPEASLLQGGVVGKYAGAILERFFNTTGALVLVGGGYLVTFLLTTGLSLLSFTRRLFNEGEEEISPDSDEEEAEKAAAPEKKKASAPAVVTQSKTGTKRKSRKKKSEELEAGEETAESVAAEEALEGESGEEETEDTAADAAYKVFEASELLLFKGAYSLPSTRLLKSAPSVKALSKSELRENAAKLVEHLLSFQITGEVVHATQGPVLTTYEFKPSAGMKLSKIAGLQDDLGIVMGTRELRIVAPIPGKTVVGIEVPRPQIETISLKDCLNEKEFSDKKMRLPIALGRKTDGTPAFGDLVSMPHLLVAGATGSGKSVFINSLIMSFLFRMSPQQLRMILVDPKMLELNVFDGLPHLITNVITDNKVAFNALSWAVWEMDRRYSLMARTGSKNIDSYNEKMKPAEKLPFIVVVVDELADLMMSGGEAVEIAITRLAQKARAAGIHLVIATQRPSTDVITGLIKANIPSRLSFKVPSGIDSRTVLDASGAEELIGRGDSLMIQPAVPMRRLHGTFVTEDELKRVVKYCIGGKDHSDIYLDFSGKNPNSDD